MTTLYAQQPDATRIPHHPAHCDDAPPLSAWRRIINRIRSLFT